MREGKLAEAVEHYRRAIRTYDADARIYTEYAGALFESGKYQEALEAAKAAWTLTDSGLLKVVSGYWKARALLGLGDRQSANAVIDETRAIADASGGNLVGLLSMPLVEADRLDEAEKIYVELSGREGVLPWLLYLSALPVDRDAAFRSLHETIDHPFSGGIVSYIRIASGLDELRADPRWTDVIRHLEAKEAEGAKLSGD